MNVEIGTEAAQFPEKEFKRGIFFTVQGEFLGTSLSFFTVYSHPMHRKLHKILVMISTAGSKEILMCTIVYIQNNRLSLLTLTPLKSQMGLPLLYTVNPCLRVHIRVSTEVRF
jgi:hypothetical protein